MGSQTVKNLTIVSAQLVRLAQDLDPPASDRINELEKKLRYILEKLRKEETPIYRTPKTLRPPTNKQFIFPFPATVRDLLGMDAESRKIIVTIHEDCEGDRWCVIKLV